MSAKSDNAPFDWKDPFLFEELLTEEERMIRDAARQYCQEKLLPRVRDAYRKEQTDPAIFREMGELGLLGPALDGYGCSGGFRFPLDVQCAVLTGDASHTRLRQ
jgi:glutaryl-CoA dehydrogenase